MTRLKKYLWPLACGLWVAAPIVGWGPGLHPRISQFGWWIVSSILVIAVGLTEKPKREIPSVFGLLLLGCLAILFAHWSNFGLASAWLLQVSVLLPTAYLIAERGNFAWLRNALLLCAFFQFPVLLAQKAGLSTVWLTAGQPPWGTVVKRGALSILFGLASIWSEKQWMACLFALMALLTGSFSGAVPALLRLVFLSPFLPFPSLVLIAIVLPIASIPFWMPRLLFRLDAWKSLVFLKRGWLTGWGFLPLPGGFQDDSSQATWASPFFREYHSTVVDWVARHGLIGLVILLVLLFWIAKRTVGAADWRKWTLVLAVFASFTQSAEAFPFMAMLFLCWLIGLCYEKGDSHVVTVPIPKQYFGFRTG